MQIGKSDLVWSYAAQILKFGSSLFILPIVLSKLEAEEMAIWYLFMAINSMVMLLDFGFSSTIVRNLTYVFAGAKVLKKEGIEESNTSVEIDKKLLAKMIHSIKSIYQYISLIAFFVLLILGTYYLNTVLSKNEVKNESTIWISWFIFICSSVLMVYFMYLNTLLMGRGFIKQAQQAQVIYSVTYLLFVSIGLFFGYGLIAVSLSMFIACVVERLYLRKFFYDEFIKNTLKENIISKSEKKEVINILWFNAKKMGVVAIGGFWINKMGQFFITSYFSLNIAAKYGLTTQIITFVSSTSIIYFNTIYPKIIYNFYQKKFKDVQAQLGVTMMIVFLLFLFSGLGIILLGNNLLLIIKSKTMFLDNEMIILILITAFLETQHSIMANVITFSNKIVFVKPALISGISILILTYLCLEFFITNIWFVITIQFLVQLSYNNWKWPVEASKLLNTKYIMIIKNGINSLSKEKRNVKI